MTTKKKKKTIQDYGVKFHPRYGCSACGQMFDDKNGHACKAEPMTKHTPTPYAIDNNLSLENDPGIDIYRKGDEDMRRIATVYPTPDEPELAEVDAAFIVRACNSHEALITALKDAFTSLRTFRNVPKEEQEWTSLDDDVMTQIQKTLKQAEGK